MSAFRHARRAHPVLVATLSGLAFLAPPPARPDDPGHARIYVSLEGSDSRACSAARSPSGALRTIRGGLACAGPGDTVDVLEGVYEESLTGRADWPSGTPDRRIVLRARPPGGVTWRPDPGETLAGFGHLRGASWVRIEGFVFEGSTARHCLVIEGVAPDPVAGAVEGIEIVGNAFRGNGDQTTEGRPACLFVWKAGRSDPGGVPSVRIERNTFEANAGIDVHVHSSTDVEIVANEMKGGRAGFLTFSSDWTHRGVFIGGETSHRRGHRNNRRIRIAGNHIHGFSGEHPDPGRGRYTAQGIKCDVNGDTVLVEGNVIHDLPHPDDTGIMVESRCDRWIVRGNLLYRTGDGIRFGTRGTGVAREGEISRNTIYDVNEAISLTKAQGTLVRDNIAWCGGSIEACMLESDSSLAYGGNRWRHNLWRQRRWWPMAAHGRDPGSRRPNRTCSGWLKASGEVGSLCNVDPGFVSVEPGSEDFRLRPGSPAIGAGEGGADPGACPQDDPSTVGHFCRRPPAVSSPPPPPGSPASPPRTGPS